MSDKPINNGGKTVDTKFKEGNLGGPGRPPGSKNYTTLLEEAINNYETTTGKKLFDRLIQRAFINDNVLLNVTKKLVPDKTHTEISGVEEITFNIKHLDNGNKPTD